MVYDNHLKVHLGKKNYNYENFLSVHYLCRVSVLAWFKTNALFLIYTQFCIPLPSIFILFPVL